MKIAQVSGMGTVWGAYSPDVLDKAEKAIGGGEAAMLQTSFGLAKLGHTVTVYYPGLAGDYRGVKFLPMKKQLHADVAGGDYDTVVSWSDHKLLENIPDSKLRVFSQQLNDLPNSHKFWKSLDALVSPSLGHLTFLTQWMPLGINPYRAVVSSGIVSDLHLEQRPLSERANVVSYWSSPDRGLHHLLALWPEVVAAVPDAELRIFYHLDRFRKEIRGAHWMGEVSWRGQMLDQLVRKVRTGEIQNVKILGPQPRKILAQHQMETKVWAFPFDPVSYTEGFCVSGGEAISAGCIAVARPDDAIEEVYGDAITWIRAPVPDPEWRKRFAAAVISGLNATEVPNKEDRKYVLDTYTWDNAASQLEVAMMRALEIKRNK
ncbi:MAG: hypothetical protein Q7R39_04615 [Dehalococcoidia bacterium]|nr:hypothetical protein [Dehalococcoidia bacterium]